MPKKFKQTVKNTKMEKEEIAKKAEAFHALFSTLTQRLSMERFTAAHQARAELMEPIIRRLTRAAQRDDGDYMSATFGQTESALMLACLKEAGYVLAPEAAQKLESNTCNQERS